MKTFLVLIILLLLLIFFEVGWDDLSFIVDPINNWVTYPFYLFVTNELFQLRVKHPIIYFIVLPILLFTFIYAQRQNT
jgi:hypothetical protein